MLTDSAAGRETGLGFAGCGLLAAAAEFASAPLERTPCSPKALCEGGEDLQYLLRLLNETLS